jgi:hypothetical protein
MHVVGGIYFERCLFPPWNQLYGSAGRAAAVIAQNGSPVTLHSYVSSSAIGDLQAMCGVYGFTTAPTDSPTTYAFDYVHPLAEPKIIPTRPTAWHDPIRVDEDLVLRFGMIEGDALVHARIAVYDPQSAFTPAAFEENGSTADRLAVIMNAFEARSITGGFDANEALSRLLDSADVAIIKQGAAGALVGAGKERHEIPAYRTESTFSIGSGDVFSAAFTYLWAVEGRNPFEAANLASLAVAAYVESRALPLGSLQSQSMTCVLSTCMYWAPTRKCARYISWLKPSAFRDLPLSDSWARLMRFTNQYATSKSTVLFGRFHAAETSMCALIGRGQDTRRYGCFSKP